ncbi:MAG: glycoside hydrolase family 2 TIM barrel-domain containing protein [Promethearchaeota archaeon]
MRIVTSLNGEWSHWTDFGSIQGKLDGDEFAPGVSEFIAGRDWTRCTVPSVWNLYGSKYYHHFGTVFYKKTFLTPAGGNGGSTYVLKFGGVNYKTWVWLNGSFVGEHERGYTTFEMDVTGFIEKEPGAENILLLAVDNSYGVDSWLPWVRQVDFFNYGGIHRPVELHIISPLVVDDFTLVHDVTFASDGDRVPSSINLDVTAVIANRFENARSGELVIKIIDTDHDGNGRTIASGRVEYAVEDHSTLKVNWNVGLDPAMIELWSPDSPRLYTVSMQLVDGDRIVDTRAWRMGFRKFETRGTRFYLNNRRVFMRGTNKHEDHPDYGLALPDSMRYQDLVKMKRANINCFRGSHYPVGEGLLKACDELGILFIEEIAHWQNTAKQMENPAMLETALKYFDEMHARDKNYTCLIAWSVSNEVDTASTPGRKYHEALYSHVRKVDETRLVTHISNRKLMDRCFDLCDFICVNIYDGWYGASWKNMEHVINLLHEVMMDEDEEYGKPKPIVISEFGAGAIPGFRSWEKTKWSEDFQADMLDYYITFAMKHSEFMGGTWTWLFHDFRTDLQGRPDKRPREFNNKGMIDEYRRPKLGFLAVQRLYGKWKDMEG